MIFTSKPKTVHEFVLWNNCNNQCDFCFLRFNPDYHNKILTNSEKIIALQHASEYIKNYNFEKGSHILIAGGEFFYEQFDSELYKHFNELIDIIVDYIKQDIIDIFYINTNFLYTNTDDIKNLIIYKFKNNNILSHLHLTTSYDRYGRFKTPNSEEKFLHTIKTITEEFKDDQEFTLYTNCILTKPFCEDILSNSFDRLDFIEKHNNKIYVNFLPYIPFDKTLEATNSFLFKTLLHIKNSDETFFKQYIDNILLNQPRIVWEYNKTNNLFENVTSGVNPKCGHLKSFTKYRDNNECILCEFKKFKEAML